MERLSILDTIWYNTSDSNVSFKRLVVLLISSARPVFGSTRRTKVDGDVDSPLDYLRRAMPLSWFQ